MTAWIEAACARPPSPADEIRDLNDALTAANAKLKLSEANQKWAAGYIEQLEADLRRERTQIVEQGKTIDGMSAELANLRDKRVVVAASRLRDAVDLFVNLYADDIGKEHSSNPKQWAWRGMLAAVAEVAK